MNNEKDELEKRIKNRNNWFIIITISIILVSLLIKLFTTSFAIDLSKFDFSDFLSMFLALFALGMSIAFFFKASETSNRFYDNTYTFTKDIAETLGRMEEKFGERLKHLDEGYNKFVDYRVFDKKNVKITKKEIIDEQKELEEKLKEKDALIDDMAKKANLDANKKSEFKENLNLTEVEIMSMEKHIRNLEKQISNPFFNISNKTMSYLKNYFLNNKSAYRYQTYPAKMLRNEFSMIINGLPHSAKTELYEKGFIDKSEMITEKGIHLIKSFFHEEKW